MVRFVVIWGLPNRMKTRHMSSKIVIFGIFGVHSWTIFVVANDQKITDL